MAERKLWRGKGTINASRAVSDMAAELALVNRWVPGGAPAATEADVYLCSAMVCNDQVDSYSTRFTPDALQSIARMLPGTMVCLSHDDWRMESVVGRCYAADVVTVDGVQWTLARWYWERGTEDGDAMARKINLGVWREVSLSWWMSSFTNSIDGKDFDESPYYPGQVLNDGQTVIGIMDGVEEVNEFSLVPRGGQMNTNMGGARHSGDIAELVGAMRSLRGSIDRAQAAWFTEWTAKQRKEAPLPLESFYRMLGIVREKKAS